MLAEASTFQNGTGIYSAILPPVAQSKHALLLNTQAKRSTLSLRFQLSIYSKGRSGKQVSTPLSYLLLVRLSSLSLPAAR